MPERQVEVGRPGGAAGDPAEQHKGHRRRLRRLRTPVILPYRVNYAACDALSCMRHKVSTPVIRSTLCLSTNSSCGALDKEKEVKIKYGD
jgi:hypothetical protein